MMHFVRKFTGSRQKTDISHDEGCDADAGGGQGGYTLIEILITIFIMGMILLMVNVVLIALIRVAHDTDARLKTRQGVEFALEVIRRDVKSADPATIEVVDPADPDTLTLNLSQSGQSIIFSREVDVNDKGIIRADWGGGDYTNLTSAEDIDITSFVVDVNQNDFSGTVEIIITVRANSARNKSGGEPVVKDLYKQITIITRGQEL